MINEAWSPAWETLYIEPFLTGLGNPAPRGDQAPRPVRSGFMLWERVMAKKTWIKVKRGLLLDPKHRLDAGDEK